MNGLLFLFIFLNSSLAAIAQPLPYLDDQFPCISKIQADQYIHDFKVNAATFGGVDLCNPNSDFKKLITALSIVEQGEFYSPTNSQSPNSLIGGLVDMNQYYRWASSQVIDMIRGTDDPTATATNRGGHFTLQQVWPKLSTLGRVGILIHEARHTQGYPHWKCKSGPYAELKIDGCDKDFASKGAYAVEMEYYARVSVLGKNFHPMYKSMARLMAMARANFVFNKPPFSQREALLVQSDLGDFWLFDQGRWIHRSPLSLASGLIKGRLKRTSAGATLLDGDQPRTLDLYEPTDRNLALADSYSYFKLLLGYKTDVFDMEEFDIGNHRTVVIVNNTKQFYSYNFGRGGWNLARPLPFQTVLTSPALIDGKKGYFLIDSAFNVYSYDPKYDNFAQIKQKWDSNTASVANVNGQIYSVSNTKKLYTFINQKWTEVFLPQGQLPSQASSVPLYSAFNILE